MKGFSGLRDSHSTMDNIHAFISWWEGGTGKTVLMKLWQQEFISVIEGKILNREVKY